MGTFTLIVKIPKSCRPCRRTSGGSACPGRLPHDRDDRHNFPEVVASVPPYGHNAPEVVAIMTAPSPPHAYGAPREISNQIEACCRGGRPAVTGSLPPPGTPEGVRRRIRS